MNAAPVSAASIVDRLARYAKTHVVDHSFVLVRYGIERLLWRLASSRHADDFILKGANLFAVWCDDQLRPTRDLDLLGSGEPDPERLAGIFRELCVKDTVAIDGLVFDPASVKAERLRPGEEYEGVRVHLRATIQRTRIDVQIDIGFGDTVVPPPEKRRFPSIVGLETATLLAYPLESALSEKLHALVELGILNSRLKDYHDMAVMLESTGLDPVCLVDAIEATFRRRRTPVPIDTPYGLSEAFCNHPAKQRLWATFKARSGVRNERSLPEQVGFLRERLMPVLRSVQGRAVGEPKA